MPIGLNPIGLVIRATQSGLRCVIQVIRRVRMRLRSHTALAAEALFLQRQLALYQNQNGLSQREMNTTRFTLVQPQTFKRWRRQGWRRMARENVTWGQQRIANERLLKLGLRLSPRTVRKYTPNDYLGGPGKTCQSQR